MAGALRPSAGFVDRNVSDEPSDGYARRAAPGSLGGEQLLQHVRLQPVTGLGTLANWKKADTRADCE